MKKIVIWLLVWLLCINLCVGIAVAEAVIIPNVLEGFEENESILDICWVNDTLYILGNEAIYSWRFGDERVQLYWQQPEIDAYRYLETPPEAADKHALWEQAVEFLVTDGVSLYAWQPYSAQLFEVQAQGLTLAAEIPLSVLTYNNEGNTIHREQYQVAMQGERLLLLLGTDDSSDWTKTELIGFDLPTAELKSLSTEPLVQFAVADQTKLFICQRDDENSQYTFHYMNTETGEIYPLFFTQSMERSLGSMSYWRGQALQCSDGQITGYDVAGTPQTMAYVPVYDACKTFCSAKGLCAVSTFNTVFLRDLSQPAHETELRVMGSIPSHALLRFSLENPDIAVITLPQSTQDAFVQSVLSANSDVDIYVVQAPGVYAQLREKGYLATLDASSVLTEQAKMLYPSIQEAIIANGQLMAFPIAISAESWTLNQTLWDRFELGDVPATYAELLDMMLLWQDEYADEYPDYTLIDLYGGVAGCIRLLVKEYILQCNTEFPDFRNEVFRNAMLAVLAHQNVLNANKENYGMPLIYTYEQGFGVAYNDDEQTRMMLMPAISVNEQQRLSGTLTLLTMSSKSTQQPAALRLIEYCVEHLDEQTQYMMMPALNEPLRETDHEKRLAELQAEKATLQTRLAAADEMAAAELSEALAQVDARIVAEEESWKISPESIENYRAIANHLVIPYASPFLGNDTGLDAFETVIDAAWGQLLDETKLNKFLDNLNRISRMIMLESE